MTLELPDTIPNQIGGVDRPACDGRTFAKVDPATGQLLCRVAQSNAEDVERAVAAAKQAQPAWAELTVVKRGDILREIAILMRARRAAIAELVSRETGKSKKDALGETDRAGVQPLFHLHHHHAGFGIAGHDRAMNGRRAAPARK